MIDRFTASLVRRRGRWSALALLVLVIALGLGAQLSLRFEMTDFLPKGSRPAAPLPNLGGADRIVVVVESDTTLTAATIGPVLDSLAGRLAALPGVRGVEYRIPPALQRYLEDEAPRHLLLYFTPQELDSLGARLSRGYLERAFLGIGDPIPRTELAIAMGIERTDPLGVIDPALAKLRELRGFDRIKLVDGYFAVPDQRAFFLTVEPAGSLAGIAKARAMTREVNAVLSSQRPLPAGTRLFAVGRPVAATEGFALALADSRRVIIASSLVVLLLLVLCLRRLLAPLFLLGTVLYGIALTVAAAFLIFQSISLVSWAVLAWLIGFGDEFALYVVTYYWITAKPGMSRSEALAAALRGPGPGILLGGLTSAAAFFCLVVMSYPAMVELAWLSTIGLLIVLGCAFTVLPLGLAYTTPGRDAGSQWHRWTGVAHRLGQRRQKVWVVGWIVLVAGSLWFARSLRFEPHPWKLAVRGVPVTAEFERLSQRLGASFTPFLMVSRGETEEAALALDRAAVRELEGIKHLAGIAGIVSPSRWIPALEQQEADLAYLRHHAELFSAERLRRDFTAVVSRMRSPDSVLLSRYLTLLRRYLVPAQPVSLATLRNAGLGDLIDRRLVKRGDEYFALSEVYPTRIPWAGGVVERFTATLERSGGPALAQVRFVGDALRGATHSAVLRRDMLAATGLGLALTLLVLVARFRRVKLVALCLLPIVCGVSAVLGLMGLLGMDLNILTIAVAPLIVGLGVDDGIHMVDRLARGEGTATVIAETGPPMTITTLTTIGTFAALAFATFPGVREMGLVAAAGLLVCLVASLQLVPMVYGAVTSDQ